MKNLFDKMYQDLSMGQDVVLASIVASSGSTPRGEGARMILNSKGEFLGTIGGGQVEYRSQQLAKEVLQNKKSYSKGFTLAPNQVEDLGMICGGDVTVYFQYFSASSDEQVEFLKQVTEVFKKDVNSWIITEISDETAWDVCVYIQGEGLIGSLQLTEDTLDKLITGRSKLQDLSGKRYYIEPLTKSGKVYICGGGHISQELVPVLTHVEFPCVVIDDRKEFSDPQLFPGAEAVYLGDFLNIAATVDIKANDYVVIVTRGHAHDYDVLVQALRTEASYIGLIGSRTKIAATSRKLFDEEGFNKADLERVNTPIGLAIKAETPAEIAISIAAEMICRRAELKSL
ncbi:MAG: XdhC family protein [Bacillota bacterium]|jgi:xanthine dehydrogenase accessory factor